MKISIKSVLEQSDGRWRLIILDDDYPGTVIENYVTLLDDSRITYIRNVTNLGANANYRNALQYVETPYFVMFGADDIFLIDYVKSILLQVKNHLEVSMFQPGVQIIDGNGDPTKSLVDSVKKFIRPKDGVYSGSKLATRLMVGNFTYFPSITWKTEHVLEIGFRPNFHVTQDLALICDLLVQDRKMLVYSSPIFNYRRHAGSDSSLKTLTGDRFSEEIQLCKDYGKKFKTKSWSLAFIAALVRPTVRMHMLMLLPKVASKPKDFLKTLKRIFM